MCVRAYFLVKVGEYEGRYPALPTLGQLSRLNIRTCPHFININSNIRLSTPYTYLPWPNSSHVALPNRLPT